MAALWLLPFGVSIVTPLCCLLPYVLAVTNGHVTPLLPYISDSGGLSPEASLFSQLLDFNAILIFGTAFVRFQRLRAHCAQTPGRRLLNGLGLAFASLCSLGAILMGNFRQTELVFGHGIGVSVGFSFALAFLFVQARLSSSVRLARIRFALFFLALFSAALMTAFGVLSVASVSVSRFLDKDFRLQWSRADPGYASHVVSALFEWTAVLSLSPFFATIAAEFATETPFEQKANET